MKTTANKKLLGGLIVVILIATVGAVLVTAQGNITTTNAQQQPPCWGERPLQGQRPDFPNATRQPSMFNYQPFYANLTDEQRAEIDALVKELRSTNATSEEIRQAVQNKLDEYGVLDKQLNDEINRTEQTLNILKRKQELRSEGKSWDEINQIIQSEFNLELPTYTTQGMVPGHGFRDGHGQGPHDFRPSK